MEAQLAQDRARYRAFISYSHKDAAFGRRLHRRLETYRVPKRLVGAPGAYGPVPRRVAPIFRDRDELSAAGDLTAEVRAALEASESLVVVCSAAAAASPWVAREVELFRALHPERPILAALVSGEPMEAFPEPLKQAGPGARAIEPLAADFRAHGDGPRLGLLKLVAGVLGVALDRLVQRDAQRRMRTVTGVTASAVAASLVMGLLTTFAFTARAEAERRRTEAEALVEFMLTDLRDRLEGVGRLDVLTAVNRRALQHYADQRLNRLPPDALERRARILHAIGEDEQKRGDLDAALAQFSEARRTTAALLKAELSNPDRIWAHAQSEFWVGYVDLQRGRTAAAAQAFREYRRLAGQLVSMQPDNPKYLKEVGYAEGNLCSIALTPPSDPEAAVRFCSAALDHMHQAARQPNRPPDIEQEIAHRHAWLADAYKELNDYRRARDHRLAEEAILRRLMAANPKDMDLKQSWVSLQMGLSSVEFRTGDYRSSHERLQHAGEALDDMIRFDPANKKWADQRDQITANLNLVQARMERGDRYAKAG